jgi:hypothetical protein
LFTGQSLSLNANNVSKIAEIEIQNYRLGSLRNDECIEDCRDVDTASTSSLTLGGVGKSVVKGVGEFVGALTCFADGRLVVCAVGACVGGSTCELG